MAEKTNITRDTPPEMIEADIARTRREMSGTVNEIQERLSASHLKDEVKEKLRESTVDRVKDAANRVRNAASRFGSAAKERGSTVVDQIRTNPMWDTIRSNRVWDAIRNNPVPVGMIGAGVLWLAINRNRDGLLALEKASALAGRAGELTGKAQAKMGELPEQAQETGSHLANRASESAARIRRAAQERARAASSSISDTVSDNPLGVILAGFGIGMLIGFSIPESGREKELMGSASNSLLSRAKETAQRAIHKAQHAAERAAQTAGEEFKKDAA